VGDTKLEQEGAEARQVPEALTAAVDRSTPQRLTLVSETAHAAYVTRSLQFPGRAGVKPWRRRGWLVRRMLLGADIAGLTAAFFLAEQLVRHTGGPDRLDRLGGPDERVFFLLSLPIWVIVANLAGLYDRDGERTDHSTADDIVGVFIVVTLASWVVFATGWITFLIRPDPPKLVTFWGLAIGFIVCFRILARSLSKRSPMYLQNTIIVGAGDVGQLIARKFLNHPEYGINLVGFVDALPKERRDDLGHLTLLGPPEELPRLVELFDIERVLLAFSNESDHEKLGLIRGLEMLNVQIDVVPRLFEIVGPKVGIHTVEGLPLVGIPPPRLSRLSRGVKRAFDIVLSVFGLVATLPLFAYIAWRVRRDSPGPVFYRQTRLGMNMRPFTMLKFRTMYVDTDDSTHREYIRSTMSSQAVPTENGLYKLERPDAVTPFGRWLRKTSLDELPQLLNVLRGTMSMVGPRPCIPYETDNFAPHQFDRFLVPAGVTGLWQATARAHATFGEALDMDVAYARGWSLGLDLRLLCRTPLAVLRQRGVA
jgi:exopolysaccharide biosynthesis polyprenyl glycosylphosphotransferase